MTGFQRSILRRYAASGKTRELEAVADTLQSISRVQQLGASSVVWRQEGGYRLGMVPPIKPSYAVYRFPPELISHIVWLLAQHGLLTLVDHHPSGEHRRRYGRGHRQNSQERSGRLREEKECPDANSS